MICSGKAKAYWNEKKRDKSWRGTSLVKIHSDKTGNAAKRSGFIMYLVHDFILNWSLMLRQNHVNSRYILLRLLCWVWRERYELKGMVLRSAKLVAVECSITPMTNSRRWDEKVKIVYNLMWIILNGLYYFHEEGSSRVSREIRAEICFPLYYSIVLTSL